MNSPCHAVALVTMLTLLTACGNESADVNPAVIDVESTDQRLNTAIDKARRTVGFFIENYRSLKNAGYSMKFAVDTADGGIEHIWFNPIEIDGDQIKAECANEPRNIPGLKPGDVRTLSKSQMSDWMIVVGNRCYGGYTIQVLAAKDPAAAPPYEFVDIE